MEQAAMVSARMYFIFITNSVVAAGGKQIRMICVK